MPSSIKFSMCDVIFQFNAKALRRTERASDARRACTGADCYWSDGLPPTETAFLKQPTMAPINITAADILSNFSYWQLKMQGRVVFVVALANSGTKNKHATPGHIELPLKT